MMRILCSGYVMLDFIYYPILILFIEIIFNVLNYIFNSWKLKLISHKIHQYKRTIYSFFIVNYKYITDCWTAFPKPTFLSEGS